MALFFLLGWSNRVYIDLLSLNIVEIGGVSKDTGWILCFADACPVALIELRCISVVRYRAFLSPSDTKHRPNH
jgi:hypothetical protein